MVRANKFGTNYYNITFEILAACGGIRGVRLFLVSKYHDKI
jgi:hypothetical protein